MSEGHATLVTRVWNYAHVLRRQGVPFGDYIEQITYLLFLKMDEEREELLGEASPIPDQGRRMRSGGHQCGHKIVVPGGRRARAL